MATQHLTPTSDRAWGTWLLPSIPIALVVGLGTAALGSQWRTALDQFPTDPVPGTGLFVLGIVAALVMLLGLALLVSIRHPVGAWVLAAGVALIAGAAIGFLVGPEADLLPNVTSLAWSSGRAT
jgi:hypothetical protein